MTNNLLEQVRDYTIYFFKILKEMHKKKLLSYYAPFLNFPCGCCQDVSELFAKYLLEKGIQSTIVKGKYYVNSKTYRHSWVEIENTIIDLTISQFKDTPEFNNYKIPNNYYIGKANCFYRLFEIVKKERFFGFDNISEPAKTNLISVYNKIVNFMKNEEVYGYDERN